jgi:hypothetical protein
MIPFQQVYLPSAYHGSQGGSGSPGSGWGAVISPVDGHEAWACGVNANNSFTIWQTLDSMATWKVMATLTPQHQSAPIESCDIALDQGDKNALAVDLSWSNGNGPNPDPSEITYYSANNGATWTRLGANMFLTDITTVGSTTYAESYDPNGHISVIVSHDRLVTWQTMTMPSSASVVILAAELLPSAAIDLLWYDPNGQAYHSSNGGATWTRIGPLQGHTAQLAAISWQAASSRWKLCADTPATGNGALPTFGCTTDLGATWTIIPQLTSTWECAACGANATPESGVDPCIAYQMTGSGALYDVCGNDPQDSSFPSRYILMRYASDSQTWTTVGELPVPYESEVTITPAGQIWLQDEAHQKAYFLEQIP